MDAERTGERVKKVKLFGKILVAEMLVNGMSAEAMADSEA